MWVITLSILRDSQISCYFITGTLNWQGFTYAITKVLPVAYSHIIISNDMTSLWEALQCFISSWHLFHMCNCLKFCIFCIHWCEPVYSFTWRSCLSCLIIFGVFWKATQRGHHFVDTSCANTDTMDIFLVFPLHFSLITLFIYLFFFLLLINRRRSQDWAQ